MNRCAAGHRPYEGKRCWPCYKQKRRAAGSQRPRTKTRGEPTTVPVGDEWRNDAACRYPPHGLDADAWFAYQQSLADRDTVRRAKAVCAACPVQQACLDYAMDTRQPWGVWGGKTADERGTGYHQQRIG